MSESKTSVKWQIVNFKKQWDTCKSNNEMMLSKRFELNARSSICFALCIDPRFDLFCNGSAGVVLQKLKNKKAVYIDVKFWIESIKGQKFGKTLRKLEFML